MTYHHQLALALMACAAISGSRAQTLLSEDFTNGIPATFTAIDYDGMNVQTAHFKAGNPTRNWFVSIPGADGSSNKAAYSCSLRQYDNVATDNWLITPQLTIDQAGLWLAWDAHSVHRHLPESYQVMISTTGTEPEDFKPLFTTEAEPYRWTHHLISLDSYCGQQVYIAFVHTSTAKYLLALDNLFVGVPSKPAFTVTDQTLHSCGNTGTTPVVGTYRNDGPAITLASIDCTLDDGTQLTQPLSDPLATGTESSYHFDVPVTLNSGVKYKVEAVGTDGTRYALASDSVWCTAYPRVMMMDKVSAYWCNNCPDMELLVYDLEDHFGSQFIEVNVQGPGNNGADPGNLVCDIFEKNMHVVNYPTAFYNRRMGYPQYQASNDQPLAGAIRRPCVVGLQPVSATLSEGHITVTVSAEWAEAMDNAKDNLRLGYTLLEETPVLPAKVAQANNLTLPSNNEFYFLPTAIKQPVVRFPHVARGTEVAFSGLAGSFPTAIEARKPYEVSYTFDLPADVSNPAADNLRVVAYVLNKSTSEALNAAVLSVTDGSETGIAQTQTEAAEPRCTVGDDGNCTVRFAAGTTGTVSVYGLTGTLLVQPGSAAEVHHIDLSTLPAGCYLVKMQSARATTTARIVKR